MLLTEFKVALRSFEETKKCQQPSASGVTDDRVMIAQPATQRTFGRDAQSSNSGGRAAPASASVIACVKSVAVGYTL